MVQVRLDFTLISLTDDTFELTFPDAIPLPELFTLIDEHYSYRSEITKLRKSLEDRTYQFRVI
jgi:PTHB1 C-terminus